MNASPDVDPATVRRRRLQLLLIALMFFGPLALSFWVYYGDASLQPQGRVQHGDLISPARALPTLSLPMADGARTPADFLKAKWSLVYVAGAACDAACEAVLADARSIHFALSGEMMRVRRVLLCTARCGTIADPGLQTAWLEGADGERLLAAFPSYGPPVADGHRLYVIDPLGNLLMSYPAGTAKKGILKDLEKLLRLSHIG